MLYGIHNAEDQYDFGAILKKLDDLDKKHYASQQKDTDVKAQSTMSSPDKKGGNFSDFDNSDDDIASLLADDDDDIFAKKAFGDSPSKKASLGHTFPLGKSEDFPKTGSKVTQGVSSKSSPKRSLSKSSSKLSDDGTEDDVLNAFLSESSLPSFLADSKNSSPVKKNSKKATEETEETPKLFTDLDKPSKTALSQSNASKNIKSKSPVSDDEDSILKSLDSDRKASGTPRKQRSGSFFDDFLKTLSPKSSPKKSVAEQLDDIKGDDSEDDDLLKSLESDVKAPASPRKRSGSFFDDFLKNISPKQSPKKAPALNTRSVKIDTSKSQDSEEEELDILGDFSSPKKSFSPVRRNPAQEKRRESLQKQVSFKGIPESLAEQSPKQSPVKEKPPFIPKIQSEKVASEAKMASKPVSQPKRSERMGANNKDDTDWLNFFKESPKKSIKPKEPPPKSKENTIDETQLSSKDLKSDINRRRSSSADWLGLSESAAISKSLSLTSSKSKIPLETDDDWLEEKEPTKISRPNTTPGRRRVSGDFETADMGWIAEDKKIAVEKSKNLTDSPNLLRGPASLSETSIPTINKKNVIAEAQNLELPVVPQESRVASAPLQFEKETNLQSLVPSGNRRDKYSTLDLQNSVKNAPDSYAHRTVSKDSGFSQESAFDVSANSHALQTVINNHIFERDQLLKSSEAMKIMYEERIKTLENFHKDQFKALEDSLKNMEAKGKAEMEEKFRVLEEKLKIAAEEKRLLERNFKTKQEETERENLKEIQKLKELHNQSIALMKQDHEEALLRLKRLKEQEIEALLSTQAHSRSLQHLTEQLEARTAEMASLQAKLEERNQVTMRDRQALLDAKEKDLRSLQNRLQKQMDNSDEERDRLQQLVLKLESRLQKYATEGEEERWELQQMKARLSVKQKHLDEEYKLQVQQVEREKEKIRLSQDSLLYEQKTVLVQLAQERQQLMQEKAEVEFLAKKIKEDDAKLHVKILKEETFIDRQKQVIQQEQGKLNFEKSNIKQELELLERERDALQSEKQMIQNERMKLNELSFKLRRRENELEMLSASTAEEKARGQADHAAALRIKADQQSREQQITKKMQELMEKEHLILSEKEKLAEERLELERKKNSVLCNKCRLSLGHPVNAPPIGIDHTSISNVNNTPVVAPSLVNGISNLLVPPHLDPSLLVWYITAQKDREFLQEELSFLRSLKESGKKESSKLNFSKK
ncbi:Fas-binding factor 1 [Araneus ventricosus]|uniref:Fas-binding factor 1 n=1 Tax=Araneus ventricosus TaxID=182803 RepID=A0A4Y2I7A7_ARAVE|nr:Fas-binding factor 1 [Araneus ventricosus]